VIVAVTDSKHRQPILAERRTVPNSQAITVEEKLPAPYSRARWGILVLLFLSMTVNLIDRQVLSVLAPVIRDQLRLSNAQYSYIVASFLLGMVLTDIFAGILLDRCGVRFGLPFIMLWWSVANGLQSIGRGISQFCTFRFLMGMGQCGNWSAAIKVISQWFPCEERALAGGIFNGGGVIGAFLAPPIVVAIAMKFGWRMAFVLPSALGLLWIVPWLTLYREHDCSRAGSKPGPTLPLLRIRELWGAVLMRALSGSLVQFYWYWLPEYLKRERHLSMRSIGLLAGVPFLFAGLGSTVGGWFSGSLIRRGWTADRARKLSFALGAGLCLLSMLVPIVPGEMLAVAVIGVAIFGVSTFVATHIGMLTDLFPETVLARMTGVTGVGEHSLTIVMMLATGVVVDRFSYLPVFIVSAVMPALGVAALYIFIGRIRPIEIDGPLDSQAVK
jgi:ACS family hexuronate transporter-like MFS transporter